MKKLIKFIDTAFENEEHYGIYDTQTEVIICLCCGGTMELEDIQLPFQDCGCAFPTLENAIKYYMDEPE